MPTSSNAVPAHHHTVSVWVSTPHHSGLQAALSYCSDSALEAGQLVRVPLGSRQVLGIVTDSQADAPPSATLAHALKPVAEVWTALPRLNAEWQGLIQFAARYYQRSASEVARAALPPALRELDAKQLERRLKKVQGREAPEAAPPTPPPPLTRGQLDALAAIAQATQPVLLFGATGSGKTEVYLHAAQSCLAQNPQHQVLVMVPEINLTPQLIARFEQRFGSAAVAVLHSGLTPAQRLQHWLRAHLGLARIVLGTRVAVFASLPHLALVIVDEEHDPSYKSQDGSRFSARDLAVYRACSSPMPCPVILGSATPSLESWQAALTGRYTRVDMPERMGGAIWPKLVLVDMQRQPPKATLSPPLLAAMHARIAANEQCLLLLNRRGYAPVLSCGACGWKSQCPNCSAFRVFHKIDRSLRCHHCGASQAVPRSCPECGDRDLAPIGKGTEQLQEHLEQTLGEMRRPNGEPVRIGRIDADTASNAQALATQLEAVHSGALDILVGTQMVAKGHDFRRIGLVAALNPDGALYASDFRAPERLFALLMQAGGRAGRDAQKASAPELWVQTWSPQHPLFDALKTHDFARFAHSELAQRVAAQLPPFTHQALVRAEAKTQAQAQAFLQLARQNMWDAANALHVSCCPVIPMPLARLANIERAQMLLESDSRSKLQHLLSQATEMLHQLKRSAHGKGVVRWAIDVDPLAI